MNSLQTPPGRHGLLIGENSWLSKCCFHLTLIFLTLIFVGFRPSKIHMALSLKTRNFNFGDPTTGRTPSCCLIGFLRQNHGTVTGREKRGPLSTERVQSSRSWSMEEDMNTTHGTRSPRRRYHPFLRELSRRPSSIHITLRGGEGGHNLLRYWQSTLQTLLAT